MTAAPVAGDLVLDDFAVTFPGFRFHPLSVAAAPGDRIALLGANGAGKSTLLRALAGLFTQYEGSIRVGEDELRTLLPGYRTTVGLLPETVVGTPKMTVGERLDLIAKFQPTWDPAYAQSLLSELDLDRTARVGTLSRGMTLKLSFVAAEAHRPAMLLLDEPTSGLDPVIRRHFHTLLRRILDEGPERTLIFSTHILEDVEEFADRVWVLRDGHLTTDSTLAEVRSRVDGVAGGAISSELLSAIDRLPEG